MVPATLAACESVDIAGTHDGTCSPGSRCTRRNSSYGRQVCDRHSLSYTDCAVRTHYIDRWLSEREEQLLSEAVATEMAFAPKHRMRQGYRLPGSAGSGRSVPGPWPEWLTFKARGGADSTRASRWPPLAA